ncbi:Uridine-cytidine kinase-like 1 [Linnemannia gamsii]|uniref:uridine/cytidine kinase n=1 Tax=Linnemannia gamsii TaxID=64522 RepID=A0A9P6QMG8_9FUNG|nr:Uridine-cytidine kinase-like 1 [Linnemannia gamsii]
MSLSLPASFNYNLPVSTVFIIGLAGGADAGKLQKSQIVDSSKVVLLHLHDFYKELSDEDRARVASGLYSFDHPDAFDWDLIAEVIQDIQEGNTFRIPKFNFSTKTRSYEEHPKERGSPSVILLEGIFVLYSAKIREFLNMKLFVELDDDMRLANRVARKVAEVNPDPIDHVLTEYVRFVKPAFDDFIQPSKKWADIIIPRGSENVTAIELITAHTADLLGRPPQPNSTRPSRMNSSNSMFFQELTGSPGDSRPMSKSSVHSDPNSRRASAAASPVPSKTILADAPNSQYKPVPE